MTTETDLHQEFLKRYDPEALKRFTSTATEAAKAADVEERTIDRAERGPIPVTRADYVIAEDPRRVQWEREVRAFLGCLNSNFGHKVTGPMIYEWATGDSLIELRKREKVDPDAWRGGAGWGSANAHLRHINAVLKDYFGDSRKTTILGRHVGKAYDVRKSFKIAKKKPMCLTLLPEYWAGTLDKKDQQ
jgi:hypothetical protein